MPSTSWGSGSGNTIFSHLRNTQEEFCLYGYGESMSSTESCDILVNASGVDIFRHLVEMEWKTLMQEFHIEKCKQTFNKNMFRIEFLAGVENFMNKNICKNKFWIYKLVYIEMKLQ